MIGAEQIAEAHLASCKAVDGRELNAWFTDRNIDERALVEHAWEQAGMVIEAAVEQTGRFASAPELVLHAYYLGLTDGWHLREVTA